MLNDPDMLNDRTSLLSYLATRRSGRPRDMVEPGPDADQLRNILAIAARTPDHGKLAPWRFIRVAFDRRPAFADALEAAFRAGRPGEEPARLEIEAARRLATQAPELVILVSSPIAGTKIPVWEQELSCGALAMNLLHATHALGFTGGWITGWAAYSPHVAELLKLREGERIAGFLYLGTPGAPLEERQRPSLDHLVSEW